jgi:hypothetical protein
LYRYNSLFTTPSTAVALAALELGGNHFRCDPVTGSWPLWALRLKLSHSHVLGQCTPVPTVTAVSPAAAAEGEALTVTGASYQPSEEARCRFVLTDGAGTRYAPATVTAGVSGVASCALPTDILTGAAGGAGIAAGAEVEVSIAMYGDDFYDPTTVQLGTYAPVKVRVACAKGFAGERCQYGDVATCSGNGAATDLGACVCGPGFAGGACQYNSTQLCNGPEGGAATDAGACECKRGYAGGGCQFSALHTCNLRGMPYGNGTCDCTSGYAGKRCEMEVEIAPTFRASKWAQGLIAGGTLLLVVAAGFIWYMVRQERRGEPLFVSLTQPLMACDVGSDDDGGGGGHRRRRRG